MSYDQIDDPTPYVGDEDGDVGGYRDSDTESLPSTEDEEWESAWGFRTYLDYGTPEARDAAIEAGILGTHTGNIVIVFGDGQTLDAIYFHHNSPVAHGDTFGWSPDTWARLRPIPVEMAERIHPRAFEQMYVDVLDRFIDGDTPADAIDHITASPRFKRIAAYRAYYEARRHGLPGMSGDEPPYPSMAPALGSGDPIPEPAEA